MKENEVLAKMNRLLQVLNEHIDKHVGCCLEDVIKSIGEEHQE